MNCAQDITHTHTCMHRYTKAIYRSSISMLFSDIIFVPLMVSPSVLLWLFILCDCCFYCYCYFVFLSSSFFIQSFVHSIFIFRFYSPYVHIHFLIYIYQKYMHQFISDFCWRQTRSSECVCKYPSGWRTHCA